MYIVVLIGESIN